jgi:threonine/homoserine/homoserine lactone efflux protein
MTNEMFYLVHTASTQGLIFGFCYAISIGPVNFLAIRRGILTGFQELFLVGLGAAFVDASFAYIVFAGLAREGMAGAEKIIIWGVSVMFLLYLAYSVFLEIREDPNATSAVKKQIQFIDNSFIMGFLIAASNPFTLIYWVGMVGTLQLSGNVDLTGGAATSFFSAVLVSELVWFMALGIAVHYSRNLFNRHMLKTITRFFGFLLLFYYVFMAAKVVLNLIHTGGAPVLPHI